MYHIHYCLLYVVLAKGKLRKYLLYIENVNVSWWRIKITEIFNLSITF
jgi:hypothetical protein